MRLIQLLKEESCKYEVFFDMDGTIVDFDGMIHQAFNETSGATFFNTRGQKDGWVELQKLGGKFWTSMNWLPGGKQVYAYVKHTGCPISILSAPPKSKNVPLSYIKDVIKWKLQWVHAHIGSVPIMFAYSGAKGRFAKPNRILIDDFDKNLIEWKNKGGIPIHYSDASSVIKQLKQLGI